MKFLSRCSIVIMIAIMGSQMSFGMEQFAASYPRSAIKEGQSLSSNNATKIDTSSRELQPAASLQSTNKRSDDCAICFDTQEEPTPLVSLDCDLRHQFHLKCLNSWLATQKSCPQCRVAINSTDEATLQLYGRINGPDAQKNKMIEAIEQVMRLQRVKRFALKEQLAQEKKKNAQLLNLVPGDNPLAIEAETDNK